MVCVCVVSGVTGTVQKQKTQKLSFEDSRKNEYRYGKMHFRMVLSRYEKLQVCAVRSFCMYWYVKMQVRTVLSFLMYWCTKIHVCEVASMRGTVFSYVRRWFAMELIN